MCGAIRHLRYIRTIRFFLYRVFVNIYVYERNSIIYKNIEDNLPFIFKNLILHVIIFLSILE